LKSAGTASSGADNIIGQFGVGFYSSFMVSDSVVVESLAAGGGGPDGHIWTSDGSGSYAIAPASEGIARGSKITMTLKEDCRCVDALT